MSGCILFKVYGYIGRNFAILSLASFLNRGQLLKDKIHVGPNSDLVLLQKDYFKSSFAFGMALSFREAIRKSQECFLSQNGRKKTWKCSHTFKTAVLYELNT